MTLGLPQLCLIRHGETAWSLSGQHTGKTDLPLTDHGITTARALQPYLASTSFALVLTSPLLRARETCDLAGLGAQAQIAADLSECDYGTYEGRTSAEISVESPGWSVCRDGCPGGETPTQVSERADRLIAGVRAVEGTIALFSHGQFGAVLAARWIGHRRGGTFHARSRFGQHPWAQAGPRASAGDMPVERRAICRPSPICGREPSCLDLSLRRTSPWLRPDPSRVVIRPFIPAEDQPPFVCPTRSRAQRLADRILGLDAADAKEELAEFTVKLSKHHRNVSEVLSRRFYEINGLVIEPGPIDADRALLIGAYFSEEYAFEAAALFNPSIAPHPDQAGVAEGDVRILLSLRGVGEGNVSSVTFRAGLLAKNGTLAFDLPSEQAISPCIKLIPGGEPDDPGVRLFCEDAHDPSEIVIFPVTPAQRHGIEDLRLVRFVDDDGNAAYLGTYTAFSGAEIRQEILRTTDFKTIDLTTRRGPGTDNGGMALFPRKIDGRYAMLGRQNHENIWLQRSDDLYT